MKDRIQKIILNEGLTPSRLADVMRVQRSSVSHILAGRNKPSMDFLTKLIESFPSINGHWLLTGQGDMYASGKIPHVEKELNLAVDKTPALFPDEDKHARTIDASQEQVKKVESKPENHISPPNSSKAKVIKKIIVIYDDYSTEEIFNG